jgi:flagellar biosynthesis GTPase FlhF
LLLGLLLNLTYFIPYFAFISVLTFYSLGFWKSMEEKYFLLQRLIYEYRDCDNGEQIADNKEFYAVEKNYYDKIRERLLPYDTNLSYFAMKMLLSFVFSLGIFLVITMLNEFNVTGVVQVVTTASLGIMPHIFSTVALKTSEERKKEWEERLKFKVKSMVKQLQTERREAERREAEHGEAEHGEAERREAERREAERREAERREAERREAERREAERREAERREAEHGEDVSWL